MNRWQALLKISVDSRHVYVMLLLLIFLSNSAITAYSFKIGGEVGKLYNSIEKWSPGGDLRRSFGNSSEEIGRGLGKGLREEFEKFMNTLFKDHFGPQMATINDYTKERLEQVGGLADVTIDRLDAAAQDRLNQLNGIINDSIEAFRHATKDTINQIKNDVLLTVKVEMSSLQSGFRNEIDNIFNQAEELLVHVDCTAEKQFLDIAYVGKAVRGGIIDITLPNFIVKLVNTTQPCLIQSGYKEGQKPDRWRYWDKFEIAKCQALNAIDENTPVDHVIRTYIDLISFAARIQCISRASGDTDYFTEEWNDLSRRLTLWKKLR